MRKYWQHGKTNVANQIVLDTQCYKAFEHNGQGWIEVTGLTPRKRIAIPLNTTVPPTGTIRLILRDGRVEVHYAVEEKQVTVTRPAGDETLGIDKGYTEVFVDSDGDHHGEGLGEILSAESDYLKVKYQRRHKLRQIARKKAHKRDKIHRYNLGRKKLDRRKRKHTSRVRDQVFKATHSVIDKASTLVTEDLTNSFNGKSYGRNQNRRLAGWVKGIEAEAIASVSRRRGSTVVTVNAAYTSQMDSRYGILLGERSGDKFYGFDGVVLDADTNAARNVLARLDDSEIQVYQPHTQVKTILLERTAAFKKRVGNCSIPDSSCSGYIQLALCVPLSTESEKQSIFSLHKFA
jgi:IS605 OrfB family transposase